MEIKLIILKRLNNTADSIIDHPHTTALQKTQKRVSTNRHFGKSHHANQVRLLYLIVVLLKTNMLIVCVCLCGDLFAKVKVTMAWNF